MKNGKTDRSEWTHLLPNCCAAIAVVSNGSNRKAVTARFGCGTAKKWATIAVPSGERPEPREFIAFLAQSSMEHMCVEKERAAAENDGTAQIRVKMNAFLSILAEKQRTGLRNQRLNRRSASSPRCI
jgi:hypothetical protein